MLKGICLWLDLEKLTITKTKISHNALKCRLSRQDKEKAEDLFNELWWVRLERNFLEEKMLLKNAIDTFYMNFEGANEKAINALKSDLHRYANQNNSSAYISETNF